MAEKKSVNAAAEEAAPAVFQPSGLRSLGAGVWVYRHEGGMPAVAPDVFWAGAKRIYGMADGDCVIFVAGRQAILAVV